MVSQELSLTTGIDQSACGANNIAIAIAHRHGYNGATKLRTSTKYLHTIFAHKTIIAKHIRRPVDLLTNLLYANNYAGTNQHNIISVIV